MATAAEQRSVAKRLEEFTAFQSTGISPINCGSSRSTIKRPSCPASGWRRMTPDMPDQSMGPIRSNWCRTVSVPSSGPTCPRIWGLERSEIMSRRALHRRPERMGLGTQQVPLRGLAVGAPYRRPVRKESEIPASGRQRLDRYPNDCRRDGISRVTKRLALPTRPERHLSGGSYALLDREYPRGLYRRRP